MRKRAHVSVNKPDLNKPFVLETDASDYGLRALLMQALDGVLRPVALACVTLNVAERNHMVTERDCVAMEFAL